MQFEDALRDVADYLGLDCAALAAYAAEDAHGGWPHNLTPDAPDWPGGSIWSVEGKFLYALVRALQPDHVFESGTKSGCSTTHILAALEANQRGLLDSVDLCIDTDLTLPGFGALVPAELHPRWTFTTQTRTQDFLDTDVTPFDFAFEDTDHTVPTTVDILSRLKARDSIKVIVSHDICHPWSGYAMQEAWATVFGENGYRPYCIAPSDCGLAVWKRP